MPYPRVLRTGDTPPAPDAAGRYPNLIAKDPRADMARGIVLYRSSGLPPDSNGENARVCEYLAPDPVAGEGDESGEFVSIIRLHILLTAVGPRYLGARRDVSRLPVPASLPEGPVADPRPYLANAEIGVRSVPVTPSECDLCQGLALRVGEIMTDYLRSRYAGDLLTEA